MTGRKTLEESLITDSASEYLATLSDEQRKPVLVPNELGPFSNTYNSEEKAATEGMFRA